MDEEKSNNLFVLYAGIGLILAGLMGIPILGIASIASLTIIVGIIILLKYYKVV